MTAQRKPYLRRVDPAKFCTVPNCGKPLTDRNKVGVCAKHNHNRPWCQCANCLTLPAHRLCAVKNREPRRNVERVAHADRKIVLVCCGSSTNGEVLKAPVTMQRFPWE
jgi:hypothetical protein